MTLTELAERCERAEGPDRELDAVVFNAIGRPLPMEFMGHDIALDYDEIERTFTVPMGDMQVRYECPAFTASIDAALTLAEGDAVDVMIDALRRLVEAGKGIDALARFTAASALRSRAATEGQTDE